MNENNDNGSRPLPDEIEKRVSGNETAQPKVSETAPHEKSAHESPNAGGNTEEIREKKIDDPTIVTDPAGYVTFRIHLSKGPLFIMGFLTECQLWTRQYCKEMEQQKKQKKGLIHPNHVPTAKNRGFWPRMFR